MAAVDFVLEAARTRVVGARPNPFGRFLRPIDKLGLAKNSAAFDERGNCKSIKRYDDLFVTLRLGTLLSCREKFRAVGCEFIEQPRDAFD